METRPEWADEVPDIHDPEWPGYRCATEDVLVAPPNARNVTPTERDPMIVTEAELRLLDGNR